MILWILLFTVLTVVSTVAAFIVQLVDAGDVTIDGGNASTDFEQVARRNRWRTGLVFGPAVIFSSIAAVCTVIEQQG